MFPSTFHCPNVVRLEQTHRVINIRMADRFLDRAKNWMHLPASSLEEFVANLRAADKELLGAVGAFLEAGLGNAAALVQHVRKDTNALRERARRQGGR